MSQRASTTGTQYHKIYKKYINVRDSWVETEVLVCHGDNDTTPYASEAAIQTRKNIVIRHFQELTLSCGSKTEEGVNFVYPAILMYSSHNLWFNV